MIIVENTIQKIASDMEKTTYYKRKVSLVKGENKSSNVILASENNGNTKVFFSFCGPLFPFDYFFSVKSMDKYDTNNYSRTISSNLTFFLKTMYLSDATIFNNTRSKDSKSEIERWRYLVSKKSSPSSEDKHFSVKEDFWLTVGDKKSLLSSNDFAIDGKRIKEKIAVAKLLTNLFRKTRNASLLNDIMDLIIEIESLYLSETEKTNFYKKMIVGK